MTTAAMLFEPNGLYLCLLDRGNTYNFHWELYLANTPTTGTICHITNDKLPTQWDFEVVSTSEMPSLRQLLVGLKVGTVTPMMHRPLCHRLGLIPLDLFSARYGESMNCRVWTKEALFALDDEGYVVLAISVPDIASEVNHHALMAKSQHECRVRTSRAFRE
ncbi:hypothetical protein N7492_004920 [Penicillium capsulatum]|uniref:Uncharacterized protein n=1 Tax=Penicillium capsulatum TaxID=69766 RepID=A0A9W9ICG5_9EURO|nr:hypothetical protein N7492_004920 [Penicillium capsulatum]KAJ6135972.1 hypothetical protein N7512_001132 [Penicillium capsulatum]